MQRITFNGYQELLRYNYFTNNVYVDIPIQLLIIFVFISIIFIVVNLLCIAKGKLGNRFAIQRTWKYFVIE